jgi:D-3-phosphoglycerate dehydrogenase
VVAAVGAVLADAEINIADFRLGRREDGNAIALVSVDVAPSEAVLEQLMKLPNMVDVRYIEVGAL